MNLRCLFGHDWDGHTCKRCKATRVIDGKQETKRSAPTSPAGVTPDEPRVDALLALGDERLASGDFRGAVGFYEQAANKGSVESAVQVAAICEHKLKDYAGALKWYRHAAAHGSAVGKFGVAVFYRDGLSVSRDMVEASKWMAASAEGQHADAQHNLGVMYLRGDGVSRDVRKAIYWFESSARQNNKNAYKALNTLAQQGLYDGSRLSSLPFQVL